ncbi:MAG: hypothetical protein AAF657_33630, partial [Acidobacteriota bacterium]
LALLLTVSAAAPANAEPIAGPVLDEVQQMLQAEMSEEIILRWLAAQTERPRHPEAADLIALKEAGASDALLAHLMDLAAESASTSAPARPQEPAPPSKPIASTRPTTTAPPPTPVPTTKPAPAPEPTAPAATAAPAPAATATPEALAGPSADGEVPVRFEMSYRPDLDEDDDEWGLYVYINGEPLTYVESSNLLDSSKLSFRRFLEPGQHVLRVTQERHEKRWGDKWLHAARMSKADFPFTLAADRGAEVTLQFRQPQFAFGSWKDPLSFRFVQGQNVQVTEDVGGDPESWVAVCEEIEANAQGGELRRSLRKQLDGCQRWPELWGERQVPSRDEVRRALALFEYRPVPVDQPLD